MKNLLTRWLVSALALFALTQLEPGIKLSQHGAAAALTLLGVVLVFGLANALIRPLIMFFVWPINCLTFGLLGFVVNVALFWLAGSVVPGFRIAGPRDALIGFVAMAVVSGLANWLLKDRGDRDER